MAFVHHTASGNDYTPADAPALMRGVYAYHTKSLGWSDIGYNFLVDRFGTIYEGRYGGMDRGVIGAQVFGFNTGSTGISVMGTFTEEAPPTAGGHRARAAARLEALHPRARPAGDREAHLWRHPEVQQRRRGPVPGRRRPSRRQLHRVPGCQALRPPSGDPHERRPPRGHRRGRQPERRHAADQPQRRRRARQGAAGRQDHDRGRLADHAPGTRRRRPPLLERAGRLRGRHVGRHRRRQARRRRRLRPRAHRDVGGRRDRRRDTHHHRRHDRAPPHARRRGAAHVQPQR